MNTVEAQDLPAEVDDLLSVIDGHPDQSKEEDLPIVDNEDHLVKDDIAIGVEPQHPVETETITRTYKKDTRYRYDSPLRVFGAFKFHPFYLTLVPSRDYRSLTYFNRLNPQKTMCPYELSGGVCNDSSCKYQHFRQIQMSGKSCMRQGLLTC
jgi:hypothetical protein